MLAVAPGYRRDRTDSASILNRLLQSQSSIPAESRVLLQPALQKGRAATITLRSSDFTAMPANQANLQLQERSWMRSYSMTAIQSICVYCGSSLGNDERFGDAARRFGRALAIHRIRLIYGGGRIGLMGQVADAALDAGGKVVGVIPEHLESLERGHRGLSELRVVRSMHERKNLMFELADAFVVLPGGLGTLDEAFEMITWRQLRLHDKPIAFADIGDYWAPFLTLVDHVVGKGFARPDVRQHYLVVADIDEVIPALRRQPAPTIPEELRRL
jgi:hypothetical protein